MKIIQIALIVTVLAILGGLLHFATTCRSDMYSDGKCVEVHE